MFFKLNNNNPLNFYISNSQIFFCLGISFIINFLTLLVSLYSMQIFDRVLGSGSIHTLIYLTIITVICIILCLKLNYFRFKLIYYLVNNKNKQLLAKLFNHNKLFFCKDDYNNLIIARQFLVSPQFCSLFDAIFVVIFLIAIFLISWINAIICVIFIITILIISYLQFMISEKLILKIKKNDNFFSKIENFDTLYNFPIAKINFLKNWQKNISRTECIGNAQTSTTNLFLLINKNLKLLFQVLLTAISSYQTLKNQMTIGGIIATSIIANKALAPFDNFFWLLSYGPKFNSSVVKIIEKLNLITQDQIIYGQIDYGNLQIKNLIFKDQNNKFIFKDLSFAINAGQSLVIVGEHNTGKTLLAKLILKLEKIQYGSIKIDNIDIENINYEASNIGYLAENFQYFNTSIRRNICEFDNNIDDQRIIEILSLCNCLELLNHSDKSHKNLSRSDQQKIALSRALITNTKILILDNPSAYLSNITSTKIIINVIKYCKKNNITLIVISNHKKIIGECDFALCLENKGENTNYNFIKNHHNLKF